MSLIKLSGMTRVPVKGQSADLADRIKELINLKHLSDQKYSFYQVAH